MTLVAISRLDRVYGDNAILGRLERLGRERRVFANLIKAGFPPGQLSEASQWFMRDAQSHVERYACQELARGYFEDETLVRLFCQYFDCTDWKLESSPWFFSREDYRQFFSALLKPIDFEAQQLESGLGEQKWGPIFLKLPFDLGMQEARRALWLDVCRRDHYWKAQADYTHMRADQLLGYLKRNLDIVHFSPDLYHYEWERVFRGQLHATLRRFDEALEHAVRRWQEVRRERARFTYGPWRGAEGLGLDFEVLRAFAHMGLEVGTATAGDMRVAFRRLSKASHPDAGGDSAEFLKLSHYRDVLEEWFKGRE